MNRVFLAVLGAFALTAGADGTLKCYQCSTIKNSSCEDPSKDSNQKLVDCVPQALSYWHKEMQRLPIFQDIAQFFEVDQPEQIPPSNFACNKMNLDVGSKKVIVRGCQAAKTPALDPCQAMQGKLKSNAKGKPPGSVVAMDYCDLCQSDGCNGAIGASPPRILHLLAVSVGLTLLHGLRHRFA